MLCAFASVRGGEGGEEISRGLIEDLSRRKHACLDFSFCSYGDSSFSCFFFFFLLIQRLLVVLTQSCAFRQSYSLAGRLRFVNFWSAHSQVEVLFCVGAAVAGLR